MTTAGDNGVGTLRQAIINANDHPGPDIINFNLSVLEIDVFSPLPAVTDTTLIDGKSQPKYSQKNPVRLYGSYAPSDTDGLVLAGGTQTIVRGLAITNFRNGIVITGGEGHIIGDSTAWNFILRNRGDGIRVLAGSGHQLRFNHNLYNKGLPIDLGGDGANPPDENDADSGPNGLANAPVIDEATNLNGAVKISGTLTTTPGTIQQIDLYSYAATAPGSALFTFTSLASLTLSSGADSVIPFSYSFDDTSLKSAPVGQRVVAVATDADGNTSEFATPVTVTPPKFYVVNNYDSGPGSLRQAILDANATPGLNRLTVTTAPGLASTVYVSSALPEITDPIAFDGLILATYAPAAFDGLVVASDGSNINVSASGFRTGIVVRGNNNTIGGPASPLSKAGVISGNSLDGIRVESGVGNRITGMAVYGNARQQIDLGTDGPTPNDPLDADLGPNELQNTPVLTAAVCDYTGLQLSGTLDSKPDTTYRIEVFGHDSQPYVSDLAQIYLGSFEVTTDATGTATFMGTVASYESGQSVTATATDPQGNTSEFAATTLSTRASTVVTNTNPRGPGSLYAALANSDNNRGADSVSFAIPGSGVHRITLSAADLFPTWQAYDLTIDATTQPGYSGTPLVELVGPAGSTGGGTGLGFNTGNTVIRGLAVGGFDTGMKIAEYARLEACYIGLAADGSPLPNKTGILADEGGVTIGGTVAAARNVISANTVAGIASVNDFLGITVQGNYIGTNPTGASAIPNGVGILFTGGNDVIGGSVAAARNVISGNAGIGIRLDVVGSSFRTVDQFLPTYIQGNYIGVAADGVTPLGNGGDGIFADGPAAFIGGVLPGQGNIIACNGGNGVTVAVDPAQLGSGQKTSIRGNSIYNNAHLPIDLANDGTTPNDPLDPDTGANTLQNSPIVTAAAGDASTTLVSGSLNSLANTTFTLDFYSDTPGASQSRTYLGSATVTTDAAGNATFTASLPTPTPPGQVVTATATGPATAPATSELSAPLWVSLPGDADRDRAVDFNDLVAVAQNYNTTGKTWSQGDFTGDGAVDFNDLVKLAQNYNTALPAPGAATAATIVHVAAAPMPSLASVLAQPAPRPAPPAPISKPLPPARQRSLKPASTPQLKPRSPFSSAPIPRPLPAPIPSPHPRKRAEILGSDLNAPGTFQ